MAEPALAYLPDPTPCPALDAILAQDEYTLPETDGLPLADGRVQQGPLSYSRDALRYHLRHLNDRVAVEGDMFVYYIGRDADGEPKIASVSPDIFVVFGVPDRPDRNSYVLWHEPDADIRFVLEIASPSTRRRDHTVKRGIYASLGVAEYFLYDPPTRSRSPRILGLRLCAGEYRDMPYEQLPNGNLGVRSEATGLVAYVNGDGDLRWFDPVADEDLHGYVEKANLHQKEKKRHQEEKKLRQEEQKRRQEAERQRDQANARVAELEGKLREAGGDG